MDNSHKSITFVRIYSTINDRHSDMFNWIRKIFKVNSIKRRIQLAFMSIILLLFFSGAMSLFELERVSHDTEEILLASKENIDLASEMISALNEQNDAMISMAVIGGTLRDIAPHFEDCEESMERLRLATEEAQLRMSTTDNAATTDSLVMFTKRINEMVVSYINGDVHRALSKDTITNPTTHLWYIESYKPEYVKVSGQITKYMTGSENTLGPDVNRLSHTARRAVTPVFLSLVVMIVVVLMFYFFVNHHLIKPILRINEGVGDYLRYRIPFDSNLYCRDELVSLRDRIVALIQKLR